MTTDFKYCSSLYVAIGRFGIYFADPEKKSYSKELKKIIDKEGGKEDVIPNSKFEIKLDNSNFYIKHPDLGDDYHKLCYLVEDSNLIYEVISNSTITNGIFDGNDWSIIINSEKRCIFAREGIKLYEDSWNETLRKFNCETMKHTTNLIPGHRYDNTDGTYYYFGEFFETLKTENGVAEYDNCSGDLVFGFLYTKEDFSSNDLKKIFIENYSKINFVNKKPKSLVDSGEFAKDNLTVLNTYSYFKDYINYLYKIEKDPGSLKLLYFLHYKKIGNYSKDKDIIDLVTHSIKREMTVVLNQIYNNSGTSNSKEVSSKQTLKKNVENLIFSFFERTKFNNNYYTHTNYYVSLLNFLGIDLTSVAENCIVDFNIPDKTIENIYLNRDYFENHRYECMGKTIIIDNHDNISSGDNYKFNNELKKFILDFILKIKEHSYKWEEFHKINLGTIASPSYQESYNITLDTYKNIFGEELTKESIDAIVNYGLFKVNIIKNV